MSNIDGSSADDGTFDDLVAIKSISLKDKYTLPLDSPPLGVESIIESDLLGVLNWIPKPDILGDVSGPASAVSGNICAFNGTSGKLIQDLGVGVGEVYNKTQNVNMNNNNILNGGTIDGNIIESTFFKVFENTGNIVKWTVDSEESKLGEPDTFVIRNEAGDPCFFITQDQKVYSSFGNKFFAPQGIEIFSGGLKIGPGDLTIDQSPSKVKALQYEIVQSQVGGGGPTLWNLRADPDFILAKSDIAPPLVEIEQVSEKIKLLSNTDITGNLTLKGNGIIGFESPDLVQRWTISDEPSVYALDFKNNASDVVLQLEQGGDVSIPQGNVNIIGNDRSILFADALAAPTYSIRHNDANKSISIEQSGAPLVEVVQTLVPLVSRTKIDTNDTYVKNLYVNADTLEEFRLPIEKGNFNDVLVSNGDGTSSFQAAGGGGSGSIDYTIGYGGAAGINNTRYFRLWGENATPTDNSINPGNRGLINVATTLRKISYSTTDGDNTTEMNILKNDIVVDTFLLTGSQGIYSPSIDFIAGDSVSICFDGVGSPPGQSNFIFFFSTAAIGGSANLQTIFNQSTEPQITTDLTNSRLVIKQGLGASNAVLKCEDQIGGNLLNVSYPYTQVPGLESSSFQVLAKAGLVIGGLGVNDDYKFPVNNTTASNGDILRYDSTTRELQFYTPPQLLYYYNQSVVSVSVNNSSEINMIDTTNAKGSVLLPANTLEVGSHFKFKLIGQVKTDNIAPRSMNMRLFFNTTQANVAFAATGSTSLGILPTFQEIFITFDITVFQTGVNGELRSQAYVEYFDDTGTLKTEKNYSDTKSFDSTINNTILAIANLNHGSPDFEYRANMITMERLA